MLLLTPRQFARLPDDLGEVVTQDREIAIECAQPVVDLAQVKAMRARQLELRAWAEKRWGYQIKGDGTAPA